MNWKLRSTVVPMVAATGLVVALGAGTAFADESATVDALSTDGYVTAAATRAAQPAPEILGLSGIEETGNTSDSLDQLLDWGSPKYYLMATTTYNTNPNPFFYNYIYKTSGTKSVINQKRTGYYGPRAALGAYGTDATDDDVWNALPDVVIGTLSGPGVEADYSSAAYAGAISAAKGVTYNPIGVNYKMSVNSEFIETMYNIAEAADSVVASNPAKKLRYGSATDIATDYESYIRGTQGYILSQLAIDGESQKVVASINSYDPATQTYKIIASGYSEGTASTNRYLEACESVSENLIDKLGLDVDENGLATCTVAQLNQADLLLIGCQSEDASSEELVDVSAILNTMTNEMKTKSFYVVDSNWSAGSMYGVVMNSPENAQNIGRILGCLYPEYVDQDDWICYYYDNFYHIKSEKLAEAIDNAMDGVRNWDSSDTSTEAAATQWTTADASTYNKDDVQAKIDRGMVYLQSQGEDAGSILTPTEHALHEGIDITEAAQDATCTIDYIGAQTYAGKNVTPDVVVRYNGTQLVEGVEYDVTYLDNNAPGVATAVIKGKGAFSGSMTTTFRILASESQKSTFSDVPDGFWGKEAIEFCNTNGLITGYAGTDKFGTYDKLTRAQAAVILCRLFDSAAAETEGATDTTGKDDLQTPAYYTAAVNWAVENGIMGGYAGTNNFGPNDAMTREQLCAIVANAAEKFRGADIEGADTTKVNALPDASGIDGWAVQSMAWCVNNGVVNGVKDETTGVRYAKATDTIDRATMAGIMFNALEGEVF